MKNSILGSVVLAAFLAGTLLTSASLYSMQSAVINEDSSHDIESVSKEAESHETIAIGALMSQKDSKHELVALFLSNKERYKELTQYFPRDIKRILARRLLNDHPLTKVIQVKLAGDCCIATMRGHLGGLHSAQFSRAGDRVVTSSYDQTARIWNSESGICIQTLQGHRDSVTSAQFNVGGDRVVTVADDGMAKIWDTQSGECIRTFKCVHTYMGKGGDMCSGRFHESGDKIVTLANGGAIEVWDVDSGKSIQTFHDLRYLSVAQFAGAGRIITAAMDGSASVWDIEADVPHPWRTIKCVHRLPGECSKLGQSDLNATGDIILTTSDSGIVNIRNVFSGKYIHTLRHRYCVNSAHFNASGSRIVTASGQTAKIWDAGSGECVLTIMGHKDVVSSAEFDGTGDRVVTASEDKTAKIWDIGKLYSLLSWFDKDCTLEHALLLDCIYELRITHALMKKRNPNASLRFDFNKAPHLQEYFDTMPPEIQACLEPFVIRKA